MNPRRITRSLAQDRTSAREEVEAFYPFPPAPAADANSSNSSESDSSELDATIRNVGEPAPQELPVAAVVAPDPPLMMAQVTLKDALRVVPEFNGKNIPLSEFFEGCDEAKEMVGALNEGNLTKLLRGKLTGEARSAIHGQSFTTIENFKDYIKNIYAPAKTVHQLQGEMGNEFQRDDETVIAFANRIRDLARRILEAKKVNSGNIDEDFRNSVRDNTIECFKRGLKPEIESKLQDADEITDIVQNAIRAERTLEAMNALRNRDRELSGGHVRFRDQRKAVYSCQICSSDHHESSQCQKAKQTIVCQYCEKPGHGVNECYAKMRKSGITPQACQVCGKFGHQADSCFALAAKAENQSSCQLCQQTGHSATDCALFKNFIQVKEPAAIKSTCQICLRVGHTASNCFKYLNQLQAARGAATESISEACQLCQAVGHLANNCPTRLKQGECRYCKSAGHTIEECKKRKMSENWRSGNGQGVSASSAKAEAPKPQPRPMTMNQVTETLRELFPME